MAILQVKLYGVFVFLNIALIALGGTVPTPFIYTKPQVAGWKGNHTNLPCNFSGDPFAVFWVKLNGTDVNKKENKASFFNGKFESFDERFEMKDDFSLLIRELQVFDEGEYLCQLERKDYSGDDSSTYLSVYAMAEKPVIGQCDGSTECVIRAPADSTVFTLDCRVTGFKPNLTAFAWSTAGKELPLIKDDQTLLTDGTWERVLTITCTTKSGAHQNLTCTAIGEAVGGVARKSITVLSVQSTSQMAAGKIAGIVIIFALVALVIIGIGLVVRKSRRNHRENDTADGPDEVNCQLLDEQDIQMKLESEINALQTKIKNYKPGDAAEVQHIADFVLKVNINLFGLIKAGKSSFFNSLNFAIKGKYEEVSPEGSMAESAKTKERNQTLLGNNVRLNDNRGMQSFQVSYMDDVADEIRGKRGVDPTMKVKQDPDKEIHCVVFVYEYSEHNWNDAFFTFIDTFFTVTHEYYGQYPLFVFTHEESMGSKLEDLKSKLIQYSVPVESMSVFENFTKSNHTEDKERNLQFLQFIWKALILCDRNIIHVERKRRDVPEVVETKIERDIKDLRIKIKDYKPGKAADVPINADYVSKVNINLFGLMGAGKSSFLNSLNFALKGVYQEISPEGSKEGSAKTKERIRIFLGDNVKLNDNRGLDSFDTSFLKDVDAQIRGKRGVDPTMTVKQHPDNEIHCVIFVYEHSPHSWKDHFFIFINRFFTETFNYYGRYPLFVFTHGDNIRDSILELKSHLNNYNISDDNTWVFENYTNTSHTEEKERTLKYLQFIWKALEECDFNINHVEMKRREQPEIVKDENLPPFSRYLRAVFRK